MEIICSEKPRTSYFIPMTPKGDKHLISPYNITPELPAKATRIKEMITNLRSSLLTDKFLQPVPYKMYEKPALHTAIATKILVYSVLFPLYQRSLWFLMNVFISGWVLYCLITLSMILIWESKNMPARIWLSPARWVIHMLILYLRWFVIS